jgi:hypothetical protein
MVEDVFYGRRTDFVQRSTTMSRVPRQSLGISTSSWKSSSSNAVFFKIPDDLISG